MQRRRLVLPASCVLAFVIVGWPHVAHAALCGKCRDLMFIDSVGACKACGGATSSAALPLCSKCSAKQHQCERCQAATTAEDEKAAEAAAADKAAETPGGPAGRPPLSWTGPSAPDKNGGAAGPAALPIPDTAAPKANPPAGAPLAKSPPAVAPPEKIKPIHPSRAGTYTSGKWHFQLEIRNPGTRSEGRWGWLTYDGQKLPRGNVNDYYETPWGPIFWVDVPTTAWGLHGWMPIPLPQNPRKGNPLSPPDGLGASRPEPGAALPLPSPPTGPAAPVAASPQTLEINRSHNGQTAKLRIGNMMVVRLPGNPATGHQWQLAAANNPAVRLTARPQYSPPVSTAGGSAALGTYTFTFQAVQAGAGTLRFHYVRPGDPNRPRESFAVGVNVVPVSGAPVNRPAGIRGTR